MLALTTLDSLMRYMGAPVNDDGTMDTSKYSAADKTTLQEMIESVSDAFEQYCARTFTYGTYTATNRLSGQAVYVDQYPIASVSSVQVSFSGRSRDLIGWSDYEIGPDNDCIIFFGVPEEALVKVTFDGGLADDTADVIANYPALSGACNLQCATLWRRHNTADRTGMTLGTGQTSWSREYNLLETVTDSLDNFYRAAHNFF